MSDQFFLYTAPDGVVKVEAFFQDETAWLAQKALAELFGVGVPAINKHLKTCRFNEAADRKSTA